ncbi:hypothetical protein NDN08_007319 [Rhodosorus marinus]|uniref:F-box domain-containing protein n=1 Tax=Rhodosorus marinus TaxID=101924 RepID=A0AAV8UG56_9RHOD|nr:hypothetical protein NDN08_007319 [Rhodosorus marinus]
MVGFGVDVLENVGRYLGLEDRLKLALTSKACFNGLQRKLDFVNAAVEHPSVLRIKHQGHAAPHQPGKWMVSGDGRVLVSVEGCQRASGEFCISRMSLPELETKRLYLKAEHHRQRFRKSRLSYSGKLLAFDAWDLRSGTTDTLHVVELGEGGVVHLGSQKFHRDNVWEIRISPSDQYIAVGLSRGGLFVMDREARILSTCHRRLHRDFFPAQHKFVFTQGDLLLFLEAEVDGVEAGGEKATVKMSSPPFTDQVRLEPLPERIRGRWRISLQGSNSLVCHDPQEGLLEAFAVLPRGQGYRNYLRISQITRQCKAELVSYVEGDQPMVWAFADGRGSVGVSRIVERFFASSNGNASGQSVNDRKSWTIASDSDRWGRAWESSTCIHNEGGWCVSAYSSQGRDETIVCVLNLRPFLESNQPWELVERAAYA